MTMTVTTEWVDAHYEKIPERGGGPPRLRCRRCRYVVNWLTRHAVERHRDTDVEVMLPKRPAPAGGWKW
jgi:hypothetical protein